MRLKLSGILLLATAIRLAGAGRVQASMPDSADWTVKTDTRLVALWRHARPVQPGLAAAGQSGKGTLKVVLSLAQETRPVLLPGFTPTVSRGRIAAGYLDIGRLPELAGSPAVLHIRPERYYEPVDLTGALSVRAVRVAERWGIDGRGVAIGVIDTGLDWQHSDFSLPDGTTRVLAVLDLSETADSLAGGSLGEAGPYGGIAVYGAQIEQALAGKGMIRQKDFLGHGTHVAGTAAARPAGAVSEFGGVAPGARLIGVKATPSPRDSVFSDVNIMNGLAFIDSLAGSLGLPWVVNMSFGSELGAHDGTDPLERFIASFVSAGQPGRAVAVASGNSRQRASHAAGNFTSVAGDSLTVELSVSRGGSRPGHMARVEFWLSTGHPGLALAILSPAGRRYGPFPDGFTSGDTLLTQDAVMIVENAHGGPHPDNGDRLVAVELYDLGWWDKAIEKDSLEIAGGTWKFVLYSGTGSFDAWVYSTQGLTVRFGTFVTSSGTVNVPGSAPELITVGAYTSRLDWLSLEGPAGSQGLYLGSSTLGDLAYFTSLGPNRRGVLKPEITAPGRWVAGSLSRWAWPPSEPLSIFTSPFFDYPLALVTFDSLHAVSQGTSFSTPHVAGVCALLLQADSSLSNSRIKDILTATAATDSLVRTAPDNAWGYGRANAAAAVRAALGLSRDTVSIAAGLDPADTLFTDSLRYTVTLDLRSSAQMARSFALEIAWPKERLRLRRVPDSLSASGAIRIVSVPDPAGGSLIVRGDLAGYLPGQAELVSLVLAPVSAARADSVAVSFRLLKLIGDFAPFDLAEEAVISQAAPLALAPVLACPLAGDVDGDGRVNIFDLLAELKIIVGRAQPSGCSDLDLSGRTDIFDLLVLLGILRGG